MIRKNLEYYNDGLSQGDKVVLGRSITLIESKTSEDMVMAGRLLDQVLVKTGRSIRIGITGVPGVGKSTFIEVFGEYLIGLGKKVAVLAVDPSSKLTGGSIMGDKTRMERLSKNSKAYIRPSSTGAALGGVNNKTREAVLLCEAAGFDIILVETVGVGQSETMVHGMVDFFLLLLLPGAGDELQGIKKGIVEMADGLIINKADGDQYNLARKSKADYLNALHLFSIADSGWQPQVQLCSALESNGLEDAWQMITEYVDKTKKNGFFDQNRKDQNLRWFNEKVTNSVLDIFHKNATILELKVRMEKEIENNAVSVLSAASKIDEALIKLLS